MPDFIAQITKRKNNILLKGSPLVPLAVITSLAAFFRFYRLTFQSLWMDELVSVDSALKGLKYIIKICQTWDINPPFHHILLWVWTNIFGNNEYTTRALSAIIGILGVIAIYYLAKELFSANVGLYSAFLLSGLNFHIHYSQEVRNYSLLFLLATISYLFFVKQIKQPSLKTSLLYTISTAVLIYTHYFGLLIFLSQVVFLLFNIYEIRKKTKFIKYQSLSFVAVGILYIPWVPTVLKMTKITQFWTEKPGSGFFIEYFKTYLGQESYLLLIFSLFLIIYFVKDSGEISFSQHRLLLITWVFVTLFIPYFRSFSNPAPLVDRYTINILPAIILMVGSGIRSLKEKSVRTFILFSILLMFFVNLFYTNGGYFNTVRKAQWREITRYVINNDPGKKYTIFGNDINTYYFNQVYNYDVDIRQDLFQSKRGAQELYEKTRKGELDGFWVIDALWTLEDEKRSFLNKNLIHEKEVLLFKTGVSLYVSPRNYSVSNAPVEIPINWLEVNGPLARISTPKMNFKKGNYGVTIYVEEPDELKGLSELFLTVEGQSKTYQKTPSIGLGKLSFDFFVENPGLYRLSFNLKTIETSQREPGRDVVFQKIDVQKKETIEEFLEGQRLSIKNGTFIISAMDDAKSNLNESSLAALERIGLKKIRKIKFRDSYLAVLKNGKVVYEEMSQGKLTYENKSLFAVSAGQLIGDFSYILIDDINYSKNERGLNFVLKGSDGVISCYSDTHKDPENLVKN